MIEKLTVIDAKYSGLEKYFPARMELDVNSPIILVTGPNGSGKTAFIRFLASSLQNERYFREHGLPRMWALLEKELRWSEKATERTPGWFYPGGVLAKYCCSEAKHDSRYDFGINEKEDIKAFRGSLLNPPAGSDEFFYELISASTVEKLKPLLSIIREEHDFNRWRYLKASPSRQRYLREFMLPLDEEAIKMKSRRYTLFDESYDGRAVIRPGSLKECLEENANMDVWSRREESPSASRFRNLAVENKEYLKRYPAEIDRIDRLSRELLSAPSPGQALRENIEYQLAEIKLFFTEKINPRWEMPDRDDIPLPFLPDHLLTDVRRKRDIENELQRYENVPDSAELIVFMDEPTIYLDYRHKHEFAQKIQELAQHYHPRLQFFISTNDAVLIEKTPHCRYVNLYTQPATATATFTLP